MSYIYSINTLAIREMHISKNILSKSQQSSDSTSFPKYGSPDINSVEKKGQWVNTQVHTQDKNWNK